LKDVKLLLILHLPPPVHGASLVGGFIQASATINGAFDCRYVNLGTSTDIGSIGRSSLSKWLRLAQIKVRVLKKLLSFKPDMVYMTLTAKGPGFYKDAVIALLVKAFGVKVVYHFHNKGVVEYQHRRFDDFLYRHVFRNAHVILLSESLYGDVAKYVPRERAAVCPNGIPDTLNIRKAVDYTDTGPLRLLFLSNLLVAKGVFVLLDACTVLIERGVSFQLTVVGNEGDISVHGLNEAIEQRSLQNNVSYRGSLTGSDKDQQFAEHDVFVLPSLNECLPLVVLEAMRAGLPVVATQVGAIPDVVTDDENGLLVPPNGVAQLADAIERLAGDPALRQRMGVNGRKRFLAHYTLDTFERRFIEVIHDIATN
jgi:glycosyltransferase involved in cell wall biosynthesis